MSTPPKKTDFLNGTQFQLLYWLSQLGDYQFRTK